MLIIRNPTNVFDTEEIQRGTLIYAKHKSWSKGEQGFVVSVGKQGHCAISTADRECHEPFFIYADEVANGDWEIRYSKDMQTIVKYPEEGAEMNLISLIYKRLLILKS